MWSISGLVRMTLAWLRIHVRSSNGVSPSYVAATRSGTSHSRKVRSWSWARALVGKISSAVSRPPPAIDSTIGTW